MFYFPFSQKKKKLSTKLKPAYHNLLEKTIGDVDIVIE